MRKKRRSKKPMTMSDENYQALRRVLEQERQRLKSHRYTKKGQLEEGFESIEHMADIGITITDRGDGAEKVRQLADMATDEHWENHESRVMRLSAERRKAALDRARKFIKRNHPHCLRVFDLIVKNGKNRQESILDLAQRGLNWREA